MVRAVFRPEAALTLFLRMRTKNRQNIAKMYSDRRVIHLIQEICVARSEWRGQIFDRKLVNRRFCACSVKIGPKLAYCVVKSPKF